VDPEQIYTEVLQEEQQKGSAAPVAEGRAKAARQRAVQGSPHPKEARWWPGSQPHLEGGAGGDAAAAPEEAAEDAAAAVAAEPEPEPAPAPAATPAHTPADAPTPEADASLEHAVRGGDAPLADQVPAPVASSTPAPAEVPAAAAVATEPAPAARPSGVTHGTPAGNRLRPEDGVSTEAQFEGQRAMYDRRKLIDDLVATGVPEVAAEGTGRQGSPLLALLYVIIPIVAVAFLIARQGDTVTAAPTATTVASGDSITASGVQFTTDKLELKGPSSSFTFTNSDPVTHNFAIYKNEKDGLALQNPLFTSDDITAGSAKTFDINLPPPGTYRFQCDYHAGSMNGTLTVK
jgi:plastocyanin